MDSFGLFLCAFLLWAWLWPHTFGRWLGHIVRGTRSAINDKDLPDADP